MLSIVPVRPTFYRLLSVKISCNAARPSPLVRQEGLPWPEDSGGFPSNRSVCGRQAPDRFPMQFHRMCAKHKACHNQGQADRKHGCKDDQKDFRSCFIPLPPRRTIYVRAKPQRGSRTAPPQKLSEIRARASAGQGQTHSEKGQQTGEPPPEAAPGMGPLPGS